MTWSKSLNDQGLLTGGRNLLRKPWLRHCKGNIKKRLNTSKPCSILWTNRLDRRKKKNLTLNNTKMNSSYLNQQPLMPWSNHKTPKFKVIIMILSNTQKKKLLSTTSLIEARQNCLSNRQQSSRIKKRLWNNRRSRFVRTRFSCKIYRRILVHLPSRS